MNKKTVMNDLYDSALITLGAAGVGFVTRKAFKGGLSTPSNLMSVLKLTASVGVSIFGIKYAQDKIWLPVDPFKN